MGGRNYCSGCSVLASGSLPEEKSSGGAPFPGVNWGVAGAILVFLAAYVPSSLIGQGIRSALKNTLPGNGANLVALFVSSCVLYALLLLGMYLSAVKRHGAGAESLGLSRKGLGRSAAIGAGLGTPVVLFALGTIFLAKYLYEAGYWLVFKRSPDIPPGMGPLNPGKNPILWILVVFTLVVLAPVCEELFFRGYLYPPLRNRMGMQAAMLLNGFLFAAAHFDLLGFLPRFVLGYGFSYIYDRDRNIAAPIAGHALYNGLLIILSLL